ncbi:MobP3 family relaxase [Lacrimispora defluvii]|uniref:Sel1 repeat family protein n=1 Tax=Lacrimispora defluvii TaxID=2719233 RepID=A0ABX1VVJ2_9FIRM|nr:MobP3 family relaxase [Lacrimispora defluvii]NNJ32055.1 sel1 repeat family protein [Lacrimispora defluvii]
MPRLILKCPYLKSGTEKVAAHLSNLITYMATRSGVEKLSKGNSNLPSTVNQEELIKQIIKEFPGSKNLFEYEDYIENKTIENASEFITISLEQNLDKIGQRKNYVDYIANRPRVERMGPHGLFTGGDDEIVLSRIAEEVANHTGNVWIPIISLRREDSISTGYDIAESWHNMLSYFAPEIAASMKIPIQNFRWYAAFHNESHHPHVHMVCYSVNHADGYLTKKGIEKMKSGLVKNIFKNEMQIIYAEQTQRRDQLKEESKGVFVKLISEMKSDAVQNPKIEELLLHLSERLKHTKGKKVYGYLQPNLKVIVDEIADELSKEEKVAEAYELWYEMREEVLHSYMDTLPERLLLSQQKEFKSIKNMIIAEADKIAKGIVDLEKLDNAEAERFNDNLIETDEIEIMESSSAFEYEPIVDELEDEPDFENHYVFVKWTDEYKQARDYLFGTDDILQDFEKALKLFITEAERGNVLATFDIGRIYADGLGVEKNPDKANNHYVKALAGFQEVESIKAWKYTEYRIGKMFATGLGTEKNYQKAAQWFDLSADKKYKYAQYSLGALYHRGQGVEQDFQTAFALYLKSAKQGFPYADYEVAKMYRDGVGTDKDEMKSNQHFQKAFRGLEHLEKTSHDDKIQYRLGWMLQNGIGTEIDIARAKEYFEKSAKMGNTFSGYALAKLILKEENPSKEEVQKAIKFLKSVAEDDCNDFNSIRPLASYALGKIYLEGKCVAKDINQAVLFLMKSAKENNQWASYQLGKLFLQGNEITKDTDKAVFYLTKAAEQGNQFAQYILGKMYLLGKDVLRDKELAIKWLTKSAEQGNEYAKFFLDNLDKLSQPSFLFSKWFRI